LSHIFIFGEFYSINFAISFEYAWKIEEGEEEEEKKHKTLSVTHK
jgi:hypothetical protein